MERLTELVNYLPLKLKWVRDAEVISKLAEYEDTELEPNEVEKMKHKLADYEDDEEEGRQIKFPVAIGDHLWKIDDYGIINEMVVGELIQTRKNGQIMLADTMGLRAYYPLDLIGKTIFYTYEEAVTKLLEELED